MSEAVCPHCHAPLAVNASGGTGTPTFTCRSCGAQVDPLSLLASAAGAGEDPRGRRLLMIVGGMLVALAVLLLVVFLLAPAFGPSVGAPR